MPHSDVDIIIVCSQLFKSYNVGVVLVCDALYGKGVRCGGALKFSITRHLQDLKCAQQQLQQQEHKHSAGEFVMN